MPLVHNLDRNNKIHLICSGSWNRIHDLDKMSQVARESNIDPIVDAVEAIQGSGEIVSNVLNRLRNKKGRGKRGGGLIKL